MKKWILGALFLVLLAVRIPALQTSYYQDEYKWALIAAPHSELAGTVPHPPLSEGIYDLADRLFGNDGLRMMPFAFSILNFFLLFVIVRKRYGERAAFVAAGLFAVSFHSILASMMVDTDGQILPAYFLIALLGYDRWKDAPTRKKKMLWFGVFLLGNILGLLTKLSFFLPIAAFAIDWLIDHRQRITKKMMLIAGGLVLGLVVLLVGALLATHAIFPEFDLATKMAYWFRFFNFGSRNWFQTFIQVAKTVLYASPLLVAPLFLVSKETIKKTKLFWIFSGVAVVFYIVLFDFSVGALDRYLQLFVVPFSVISSLVYVQIFEGRVREWLWWWPVAIGGAVSAVLVGLAFLPHAVPPLQPKSAWLGRLIHGQWNFVFPFNGGSGPLGFYVSFLFMAVAFLLSTVLVIAALRAKAYRKVFLLWILVIGLVYNAMMTEEYLFGLINGNTKAVLRDSIAYIASHPEVDTVTTFNDIGGYELMKIEKYHMRLYVDPAFNVKGKLNNNKGWYLVVNIPRIDEASEYAAYFRSCQNVFETTSQKISGTVYDCRNAITIE